MPSNHGIVRQPLSCENCRNRKIRCNGGPSPCESCVRRGFARSCNFKRQSHQSIPLEVHTAEYRNLESKINSLETLLRQQIDSSKTSTNHNQSSTETVDGISTSPNTGTYSGFLQTLNSGHVQFISRMIAPDAHDLSEFLSPEDGQFASSSHEFPFSVDSMVTWETLIEMLPPHRQCDELVSIYFRVFSPLFHILHDPLFCSEYRKFRETGGGISLGFLALLFVILSIATTAIDVDHPMLEDFGRQGSAAGKIKSAASRYRKAAMKCLAADQFLWRHNLYTVKALILLLYALSHADVPSWTLLGTTVHIAVAIGCHVEPSRLNVDPIEREERRRCWAGLMMLHQIQSTCFNRPLPLLFDADIALPADINDDEVSHHSHPPLRTSLQPTQPTQMTYLLYKFKLYKIAAAVCQAATADETSICRVDERIEQEEREHVQRFDHITNLPIYHQAHRHILRNYTNHLYLLLHRYQLVQLLVNESPSQGDGRGQNLWANKSYSRCKEAAFTMLQSYRIMCIDPLFRPYKWYVRGIGSFQAFLAASTLVTLSWEDHELADTREDALRTIRSCVELFEEMKSESDLCAKAAPILHHLSEQLAIQVSHHDSLATAEPPLELPKNGNMLSLTDTNEYTRELTHLPPPEVDLDGWDPSTELEMIMSRITTQQWLTPSLFPWLNS